MPSTPLAKEGDGKNMHNAYSTTTTAKVQKFENVEQSSTGATSSEKEQFWQVKIDELRMLYEKKLITAAAYVYGIVKILRKDGWWLKFDTKEFGKEYGIPKSTLHKAITTLAADPDIEFEWTAREIQVRFGKPFSKTPESIDLTLGHSQQGELVSFVRPKSHERDQNLIHETEISSMRQTKPETQSQQGVQPSYRYLTDIDQIHTDKEGVCELSSSQEEEENKEQPQDYSPNALVEKKVLGEAPKSFPHEKGSAAALNKTLQKPEWNCPGTPEEKGEFLRWKGEQMLSDRVPGTNKTNARSKALAWANKHPEEAQYLFEDWQASKQPTQPIEEVQEEDKYKFHTYSQDMHWGWAEEGLERLKTRSGDWFACWTKFICDRYPRIAEFLGLQSASQEPSANSVDISTMTDGLFAV